MFTCCNSLQKPHFIRCVRPNFQPSAESFDKNFVLDQLRSSGTLAYYELMQFGYPVKIHIADFYNKLKPVLKPRHVSIGDRMCCFIFLLASGFKAEDLKFGKSSIHIRPGNSKLFEKIQTEINGSSLELALKFQKGFVVYMRRICILRLKFVSTRKLRIFYKNFKQSLKFVILSILNHIFSTTTFENTSKYLT